MPASCMHMRSPTRRCRVHASFVHAYALTYSPLPSARQLRACICAHLLAAAECTPASCMHMRSLTRRCRVHASLVHAYALTYSPLPSARQPRACICAHLLAAAECTPALCMHMRSLTCRCRVHASLVHAYVLTYSPLPSARQPR